MAKFYSKKFEKDIVKALGSKQLEKSAHRIARRKVDAARAQLLTEFESHPVTREIEGGKMTANTSGTLGGYGNLFTFIGFQQGSQPMLPIRNYLNRSVRLSSHPKIIERRKSIEFNFKLTSPKLEDIEGLAPSPWEGRSWIKGIERGISGLGNYMFSLHENFKNSRSGVAVQRSTPLRALAFRPVKYMSSILDKFNKKMQ